jgi:hypothetical protein
LDYAGEEGVERSRALGCLKLLRMTDRVLAYEANPRGSPALSSAISCILNMHTPNNGGTLRKDRSLKGLIAILHCHSRTYTLFNS